MHDRQVDLQRLTKALEGVAQWPLSAEDAAMVTDWEEALAQARP